MAIMVRFLLTGYYLATGSIPVTRLLLLILEKPEAFHVTQIPCVLRQHWLAALESASSG